MEVLFKGINPSFKLKGKAKYVFTMLNILATTELIEDDKDWWTIKAWIMSQDGGRSRKYRWDNGKIKQNTPY